MAVTPAQRRRVWERDQGICHLCGDPVPFEAMEADHLIRPVDGGTNEDSNLRAAHRYCNRARGGREVRHIHRARSVVVTTIRTSVEDRQRADATAAKRGLSLNTLIVEALRKEVERDGDK